MADSVVSFLVQNLSQLLENELKLLSSVEDKVISLRNELKFIDIFLESSEGKRTDEVVKQVVSQIRDVAFKAEDVVDTYVTNISKHRRRNMLCKLLHFRERLMLLHNVSAETEKIKSSIDEIYKNKERYGIGEGEVKTEEFSSSESLRKRRKDVEEEDVVGLVHDSGLLIKQLKESDSRRKVVSIIGMGGLGKTTLARKIYNSNQVKKSFHCRAWGYVSNEYRARELLLSLLKSLLSISEYNKLLEKVKDDVISEEELKVKVGECLRGNKYLIVLDDIWKTQVWDEVQCAFPDDRNGSRILITSRINEVAHYTGTVFPYYLPFLNKQESWELFSKKVFRGEECPSDLQPLGRSIAESCGGLPLAIVVLAGVVAKKERSLREWKRIKEISWHLTQDKTEVMDILRLSYDSLPRRLKPCFLYFGIFPEDYEISARDLIHLWMAEWLIQPQETRIPNSLELEDVADYYLDELVDRSLVQVATRRTDGGVKTCRIHDLLRDLCISESRLDKFFEVCTESNIASVTLRNPRRLSMHCNCKAQYFNQSCTRSLFFFSDEQNLNDLVKSFKLARVSYSKSRTVYYSLNTDLKTMIHLKYLRIDVQVKDIPASICNLWNLETLDVRYRERVSSEIWKLKRLRHVYMRGGLTIPEVLKEDSKRKGNLQTLLLKAFDRRMVLLLENNDTFCRLRKLVLHHPFDLYSRKVISIVKLPSLRFLSNLHRLTIIDFLELPNHINLLPPNVAKITLKEIHISQEFIRLVNVLGWLTNLQILKLIGQYTGDLFNLNFGVRKFPQLQVLQMKEINVTSWRLEKGAMPRLQHLVIESCKYLSELPQQLWSLTTLQQVHVLRPSKELANSLQNVKLNNGCKIIISHATDSNS